MGVKRIVIDLFKKYWYLIALLIIVALLICVGELLFANSMKLIIDFANGDRKYKLIFISLYMLVSCVAYILFIFLFNYIQQKFVMKCHQEIYKNSFNSFFYLPYEELSKGDSSKYLSLFQNDIPNIIENIIVQFTDLICLIVRVIGEMIFLFLVSWVIGIICLVLSSSICIVPKLFNVTIAKSNNRKIEKYESFTDSLKYALQSFLFLKSYNLEEYQIEKLTKGSNDVAEAEFNVENKKNILQTCTSIFSFSICVGVFIIGAYLCSKNYIKVGDITSSIQISSSMNGNIISLFATFSAIISSKPFLERLDILNKTDKRIKKEQFNEKFSNLEINDLTFSYEGSAKPIINSFNATINKGDRVLISGDSGTGKTTLFKLCLGLYENYEGQIFWNSKEVRNIDYSLYSNCVLVIQDITLFHGTIMENIFLEKEYNENEFNRINDICGLSTVLKNHKLSLESEIIDNGINFSGGEKQRIGLARALLRKPSILLLDEAFSALDVESEKQIKEKLFKQEITIIEISHHTQYNESSYSKILNVC